MLKNWNLDFPCVFYHMPNLGSLRGRLAQVQRLVKKPFPLFPNE
jgi:hypothetical protein